MSNITGREAGKVTEVSQRYAGNIVGGWALGKGGAAIPVDAQSTLPVFADYAELLEQLPRDRHPNKIIIYSPPEAVYGEIKNVVKDAAGVETIFIITEHVSIEVSAKIHHLCAAGNIDVIGGNTLGVINATDHVRVGAVLPNARVSGRWRRNQRRGRLQANSRDGRFARDCQDHGQAEARRAGVPVDRETRISTSAPAHGFCNTSIMAITFSGRASGGTACAGEAM